MWNLQKIKATNIQTFKDIEYNVTQGVTTLIFGNNVDNPTQPSNGSGKSGIVEVITVGTTGSPMRKVRIDEVINDSANKATTEIAYYNNETDELLVIYRDLYKKSSNTVRLYMERGGVPVPEDEYVQSSAAEYNKFIFEKLGITEDEFLNNFVLSTHRYKSFLDASDREKKEVVNKLSNAVLVDEMASEKLALDIANLKEDVERLEISLASTNGSIEALEGQIVRMKEEAESETKEEKIGKIKAEIKEKELELLDKRAVLTENKSLLSDLKKVDDIVASIDEDWSMSKISKFIEESISSDLPIGAIQCLEKLSYKCNATIAADVNTEQKIIEHQQDIDRAKKNIEKNKEAIASENEKMCTIELEAEEVKNKYKDIASNLELEYDSYVDKRGEILEKISQSQKKIATFDKRISHLQNVIAGTITCPKCKYQFLLDSDIDIEEAKGEIEAITESISKEKESKEKVDLKSKEIDSRIREISDEQININKKLKREIDGVLKKLDPIREAIEPILIDINNDEELVDTLERNVASLTRKLSRSKDVLIDSLDEHMENEISQTEAKVKKMEREVVFLVDSIDTLKEGIDSILNSTIDDNIASLDSKLTEYKEKRADLNKKFDIANNNLYKLEQQEMLFVGFKTYLANTKIDALSNEINYFLEHIGSDLRVQLDGYTATKTGKVRERITVSVLRDGLDFGSFYKLSEGEKSTIQIATILAQQKLINIAAPDTKGLNLLVVDEILDRVDGGGLSHIFETINKSQTTSLVVSHGNIAENYPYRIIVNKKNGVSSLSDLRLK